MTTAATSQPPAPAADCDALLRQGWQLLDAGQLAPASAAGWKAAQSAVSAYAGPDVPDGINGMDGKPAFQEIAGSLLNHYRGDRNASEWVFSALALSDNSRCDWLNRDGVSRRLDDVQRLSILVQDIANPQQTAADLLRQAQRCMDNGSLAVASEKGWQAALLATKTYADAVGCDYRGEYHFEAATRLLAKDAILREEVIAGESGAASLRRNASYCTVYPYWLYPEIVASDLAAVSNLADLIQAAVDPIKRRAV